MTPRTDRLSKAGKIGLCTTIAVFAAFLVIGTTWGRGGGGGGGGKVHTSSTEQCTVCHGSSLTSMHQEAWSTSRTGCYICHPTGRRGLYAGLPSTFDCLGCHTESGVPADYHMNMVAKHTCTEAFCTQCHMTDLPQAHEGLAESRCLACHVDLGVPLPDNANCTSCHEVVDYNPTLNQCIHGDDIESHGDCINCHLPCP